MQSCVLRNSGVTVCSLVCVTLWHMSIIAGNVVALAAQPFNPRHTIGSLRTQQPIQFGDGIIQEVEAHLPSGHGEEYPFAAGRSRYQRGFHRTVFQFCHFCYSAVSGSGSMSAHKQMKRAAAFVVPIVIRIDNLNHVGFQPACRLGERFRSSS